MDNPRKLLRTEDQHVRLMIRDAGEVLKRFFLCEESLVIGQAGWIPNSAIWEIKTLLPKHLWEDAENGEALRARVFELRFPSRFVEPGQDKPLVSLFKQAWDAPNDLSFVAGLGQVLKPAMLKAYETYMLVSEMETDGPTQRLLAQAIAEKRRQIHEINSLVDKLLESDPQRRAEVERWVANLNEALALLGGLFAEPWPAGLPRNVDVPDRVPFLMARRVRQNPQWRKYTYYWPEGLVPGYGMGEGLELQVTLAIRHINEIWAAEMIGSLIFELADELGWDFVYEAARWCYDELRHCLMGQRRLQDWGFDLAEIPVGTWPFNVFEHAGPLLRMAAVFYFESTYISSKHKRVRVFHDLGDSLSQQHSNFDWADEARHVALGKRWLEQLVQRSGDNRTLQDLKSEVERLLEHSMTQITDKDVSAIVAVHDRIMQQARNRATATPSAASSE